MSTDWGNEADAEKLVGNAGPNGLRPLFFTDNALLRPLFRYETLSATQGYLMQRGTLSDNFFLFLGNVLKVKFLLLANSRVFTTYRFKAFITQSRTKLMDDFPKNYKDGKYANGISVSALRHAVKLQVRT